jgi:pantoate--beta-alanine ligase
MNIIKNKSELKSTIAKFKAQSNAINFVPTMGNLHQGHIDLVKQAKNMQGKTIVSIFVNPMQFNNQADLTKYPRSLEDDIKKLENIETDLLFIPEIETIYPQSIAEKFRTRVVVPCLSEILEGKSRPGHFDGVTTVVTKLFNLVQADHAIFGEKDFQQLALIHKMVCDLDIPITVHSHPIVREVDGLAMSSRNNRLTKSQRQLAPYLYQALKKLEQSLNEQGIDYLKLQKQVIKWLDNKGFKTDYLIIADVETLLQADEDTQDKVILGASVLGDIRLIDNIRLIANGVMRDTI